MYKDVFQIGKYVPVLQGEQSTKNEQGMLAVQDGYNFAWHTRGVFSAHSHEKVAQYSGKAGSHPHDWLISNMRIWTFLDGVYKVENGEFVLVFPYDFPVQDNPQGRDLAAYKWTYAYVGCIHYFSNPMVWEIIWYDESLDTWGSYRADCWDGPIYGIIHADNRLIILLEDVVGWSDFDNGQSFGTNWYKGTGYQSLALIRYGQPFTVMPFRNGWLTFTQRGIMYSAPMMQNTVDPVTLGARKGLTEGVPSLGGQVIYRHEELNFDDLPLGPTAIEHIEEKQVLWLSRKGFQTFGQSPDGQETAAPTGWQAEMSLFYRECVIPERYEEVNTLLDHFCLNYSREMGWLFVSSRCSYDQEQMDYDRAHVYQFELDRWGSFNHSHLHVGYQHAADERARGFYGFMNTAVEYCEVDNQPRDFTSWIKFSPARLEVPDEQGLPAEIFTSITGIRLGTSKPRWQENLPDEQAAKGALYSSWFTDKQKHEHVSEFNLLVSSGFDSTTFTVDEQEYAQIVNRTDESVNYSVHSTGLAHNLLVIVDRPNYHFDISHLEISFFFAGVA